jgi:diacylglycerol kinase (ATP)
VSHVIIANADAGSTERVEAALRVLDDVAGAEIVWTEGPDDIDAVLEEDDRQLVLAGGDGSIHLLVNRLAATDTLDRTVGLLPMGTGNDLARGLDLPFDPEEAARRVMSGRPHRLPLLEAPEGELATNNAHAGLGVAAARKGAEWKDRLGSFAYTAGSLVEGLTYEGMEVEVRLDDSLLHSGPALVVMLLIGPSAGGGFRPLPEVEVTEPVIDVLVIESGSLSERGGIAFAALRGELGDHEAALRSRATRVEVETGDEEWELDGEFRTWTDPITFRLSNRSWTVLA